MTYDDSLPWMHHWRPSEPPYALPCAVCGLDPQWHPEHQPKESEQYVSVPLQAAWGSIRERVNR